MDGDRPPVEGRSAGSSSGLADLVITGAEVYTVDPVRPWAQAVAIRSGRIMAVGSAADIASAIGRRTTVLSLPGRMVLPAFQDAHIHPPTGGLDRLRCDLHDQDPSAYPRIISAYAAQHPDLPWILGGGWRMDAFPGGTPEARMLDGLVPDRPVYLINRDYHGAWVNSQALRIAAITGETPDPSDGRVERDALGEPTGTLHEGAMNLVERFVPPPSALHMREGLMLAQSYLHSLGITAWQDAWVTPETLGVYRSLAQSGELTARVVAALWWDRDRGAEQVEDLIEQRAEGATGRLRSTSVKIMQDGVCENFTAALLDPYLDVQGIRTGNRGLSFVEPAALKEHVTRLDVEGFQVHVHAIGERAVREALDAFEAARRANGPRDSRHHIAHIQVVHPRDRPRFAALGVVANAQPLWACHEPQMDELTVPFLGPDRSSWQYPFADLLRSGASLAFGSDWSVSTPNPLLEMEVAVNRIDPGARDNPPFLPQERLSLAQSIHAFTMGSAFVNRLDDSTGSITRGKLADLVVLDRNLFSAASGPIGDARVLLTMVEGVPVFSDPDVSW